MALSAQVKADGLLLITTLLAAVSWMFSVEAIALMPPLLFMACRFLIAGLLTGSAMAARLARGAGVRHWHELLDHGSAIWRACRRRCVSDQPWRGFGAGHGLAYFR